jgi:hypothetical protein
MEPTGIVRTAAMASRASSEWETALLAYYRNDGLSNARTEAIIIWSAGDGVVDVADGGCVSRSATRYQQRVSDVPHVAVSSG